MLDGEAVDLHIKWVIDRYTPAELVEFLNVSIEDLIDAFYDRVLELKDDDGRG